jgi:hypothetical protein
MDWARAFFSIFPGRGQWVAAQIPSYGEISTQSGMTRHSPRRSPAQKGAVGGLPTPCARCGRGRREKGERSFVYERVFVREVLYLTVLTVCHAHAHGVSPNVAVLVPDFVFRVLKRVMR